jgi:predicted extracellular nuclease
MYKTILCAAMALVASSARADLVITGVIDGPLSGGVPKALELYASEAIPDLSVYGIESAQNGAAAAGEEFEFPADSLAQGEFIYVASESSGFEAFFGFAPDYVTGHMSINGDDAIILYNGGVESDVFGEVGVDGTGTAWEHLDGWAYRLNSAGASSEFNADSWNFSLPNALDGETSNTTAAIPFPTASYAPQATSASIIINEVDADTSGTDVEEFVELYDGGAGSTPLDGYWLVFYNGNGDSAYRSIDLSGLTTDANGYFVAGNSGVANVSFTFPSNGLQNGADAVALLQTDSAIVNGSPIDLSTVVDALVYDTNDSDDAGLLTLLNAGQMQINEGSNNSALESNQRCENGTGGARNTDSYIQALPTPGADNNCEVIPEAEFVLISELQGSAAESPLLGQLVKVNAVVVGDFQDADLDASRNLRGFFLQEEDADHDANDLSSEGLYIFDPDTLTDVELGDLVEVTGTVAEYFGETQLQATEVSVLSKSQLSLVSPQIISLPSASVSVNQNGKFQPELEAYEGMWVEISGTLTINEQFQLDRFNEIKLVAGERPYQFTQLNSPDVAGYANHLQSLGARQITYDDGLSVQNANIGMLQGFENYEEANAKRMGDQVDNLSGVLDYKWAGSSSSGSTWRVRANQEGVNQFTSSLEGNSPNPRPSAPEQVDGNLKVASFNVLNFFLTFNGQTTEVGLNARGAHDQEELDRQLPKLVNAITAMDADILGLVELENNFDNTSDGSTAIEVLVDAVNAQLGDSVYAYVYPGSQFVGTDAIAVGIIYKLDSVEIAEDTAPSTLDDTVASSLAGFAGHDFVNDPIFDGPSTNRVSLAASFSHLQTGDALTVAVSHFKSKGSSGLSDQASPNFDQNDGAGFWNNRRLLGAMALQEWIASSPTGLQEDDVILLGDFNAYALEEPVQYLLSNGYSNVESETAYSFTFDGQLGTLDYLLVSDELSDKLAGVSVWHINSDEADALDYNLDFGRSSAYYDGSTSTRNSDHDPVFVGLNMESAAIDPAQVLEYFVAEVQSGNIQGKGRTYWQRRFKLFAYYLNLKKAVSHAQRGYIQSSCRKFSLAQRFADNNKRPRDLIEGTSVESLNEMLTQVREQLNCH